MRAGILALLLAACGETAETCATGTWQMQATLAAGNCGDVGMQVPISLALSERPEGGYNVVYVGSPGVTTTGTVRSDGGACALSVTLTTSGADYTEVDTLNATEDGGAIQGSGTMTVSFTDGTSCGQSLTLAGNLL